MKKNISRLFAIMFISLFVSCYNNDYKFIGLDNFMLSFSITHNDVVYPARIVNHEIIVDVMSGVDLLGAKVNYKLSENAIISPKPESIEDWNEDHSFRIQANNNDFSQYTYRINRIEVEDENSVILLSQEDVDKFKDSKTNVIKGNLIIGANRIDSSYIITNLDALLSLTKVAGTLHVRQSYAGANLSGLENLQSLGNLIVENTQQRLAVDFPKLKSASNITIETDSLVQLNLPLLETISKLSVTPKNLKELNLLSLSSVSGDFILTSMYSYVNAPNILLRRIDLPKLETVLGTFEIGNFSGVSEINISMLKSVGEDFKLKHLTDITELNIPMLESIGGDVEIFSNNSMETLLMPALRNAKSLYLSSAKKGDRNLQKVDFTELINIETKLQISFFGGLELNFPKLQEVGGVLRFENFEFAEKILFPVLQSCNKIDFRSLVVENLTFSALQFCETITLMELAKLESADFSNTNIKDVELASTGSLRKFMLPESIENLGYFSTGEGTELMILPDWGKLKYINGQLDFNDFRGEVFNTGKIEHIGSLNIFMSRLKKASLPHIKSIKTLMVNSYNLETLEAPELYKVDELEFEENYNLENIFIPKLKEITGAFIFHGGSSEWDKLESKVTNLNMFEGLNKADRVEIKFAGNLIDFSGMKDVFASLTDESKWIVEECAYNPTYQQMLDGQYVPN